jgi:hypothetical protein
MATIKRHGTFLLWTLNPGARWTATCGDHELEVVRRRPDPTGPASWYYTGPGAPDGGERAGTGIADAARHAARRLTEWHAANVTAQEGGVGPTRPPSTFH